MNRMPINYVLLEGPDLAGKTTLYESIHTISKYRWNIQDRSSLSMLVHARQYDRKEDIARHREALKKELSDLNNVYIVMLPSMQTLIARFMKRGDNIQNVQSLRKVHKLFKMEVENIENLPNVFVVRDIDENPANYAKFVKSLCNSLEKYENLTLKGISELAIQCASSSRSYEATPVSMTLYDDTSFKCVSEEMLEFEKEKDYYNEITAAVIEKIRREKESDNEYNSPQGLESRRYVYADNRCISFAQFLVRQNVFDCNFVLRSSDASNIFEYDLNFLMSLCKTALKEIGASAELARIRINMNSLHIVG